MQMLFQAYERRFPTCHMIPAFLGSETVYEHKSKDGAVHVIERRCKIDVEAPYFLKKVMETILELYTHNTIF